MNLGKAQFLVSATLPCTLLPVLEKYWPGLFFPLTRIPLSSGMTLISLDFLSYLVIAVLAVSVLITGWWAVRSIHRYGSVPEDERNSKGIKDFRVDTFSLVLFFISSILIVGNGLLLFLGGHWRSSLLVVLGAILIMIVSIMDLKIPTIRITNDALFVYRFLPAPKTTKWNTVKRVDFYKDEKIVVLTLIEGKISIPLSSLGKKDREDLITIVKNHLPEGVPFFYASHRDET